MSINFKEHEVLKYFKMINDIPRGSKNEKEISDFLVKFGKDRGFKVIQDDALNVIIKVPGTKGYESLPTMIIQGHMDMVCEKNQGTEHDFLKDPINMIVDGDWLKANGTTLGADNGIAVAYGLALIDGDYNHPPLELVITADEEMGMTGAFAIDPKNITGKYLLNIDTEDEDSVYVSCAGGGRANLTIKLNKINVEKKTKAKISIRGLQGGHSGLNIDEQRGNSNKILGRILNLLRDKTDFNLGSISGGAKENAIPREADAIILTDLSIEELKTIVLREKDIIKSEFEAVDKDLDILIDEIEFSDTAYDNETTNKIIDSIVLHPNGIKTMSMDIKGLVESSINLGVILENEKEIVLRSAYRSSVESLKTLIKDELKVLANLLNIDLTTESDYPGWQYQPESFLRDQLIKSFKKVFNEDPKIKAVHAGLECGIFADKLPDVEMISFGPDIRGAHTPEEKVSISSIEKIWELLINFMENSKENFN